MARKIATRIKVKGHLLTLSPLHVGGMHLDPTVDLALAVDGLGRYYIPGTSLAGAFRNWMNCNLSNQDGLWGYQTKDEGHASFMLIEDLHLPANMQIEIRDGVGIDRQWGSAADKSKFDRAIIPKGKQWDFQMSLEIPAGKEFQAELERLLDALHAGEIRLGASKTRGLGRVQLANCQLLTQTLNTKNGMIAVLQDAINQQGNYQPYLHQPALSKSQIKVSIEWKPIGPVMVKDAIEGNTVDILPLMSANGNDQLALVLPGSSIKGALRSQAERIIRTVCNLPININDVFLKQVQVPLVSELFGAAADPNNPKMGQGALYVEDCFSEKKTDRFKWQKVIEASTEANLRTALDDTGLGDIQQAFHVAIDRWTGGAAEHMLYSNLEPFGLEWSPIELTVNLGRLVHIIIERVRKSSSLCRS